MIEQATWDAAVGALRAAEEVVLSCHVGPDGDALGSMLALTIALDRRGVKTIATWSEPWRIPALYDFLPRLDLCTPPASLPASPQLMITFDAGSLERLGTVEHAARAARTLIVVDHHASNDMFGTINLVDASAAASAVLTHDLLRRIGIEIDRDVATCLYAGVVTDTGRFQYANTTPEVHAIAADLLARGAPHDEIARRIYDTHPVGYLKVAGRALERLAVADGYAWTWVTREDLAENSVSLDDIEALIDLVRTTDVADVAIVLKQQPDGRYRVSMRSKGETDVGAVCASFGGGGHALAAGFTAGGSDREAIVGEIARALTSPAARR